MGLSITNSVEKIIVDDDYYDFLNQFRWFLIDGYPCTNINIGNKKEKVFLARMITGAPKNKYVDHINKNKLDNRLCNLRYCTNGENVKNTYRSKYRGVSFHRASKLWRSKIKYMNEWLELGYYKNEKDAAIAFNNAIDHYKIKREKNKIKN